MIVAAGRNLTAVRVPLLAVSLLVLLLLES